MAIDHWDFLFRISSTSNRLRPYHNSSILQDSIRFDYSLGKKCPSAFNYHNV